MGVKILFFSRGTLGQNSMFPEKERQNSIFFPSALKKGGQNRGAYQPTSLKGCPPPGADLALTSATIADAREVFEIVIEIQLMVLYAMKIYCKHINERDMGIFWFQPLISASNRSSGIRRTRPCRQLDPVKVGPRRTRPRRTRPCHSVAGA